MDQNQNPYGQQPYPPDPRNYPYNSNPAQQSNQVNQYGQGAAQGYQQNPQQGYQQYPQQGYQQFPQQGEYQQQPGGAPPEQSPYQQYGEPQKKNLNPLVVIIPAALIVVALLIALVIILTGSDGDSTPVGSDDISNNGGNEPDNVITSTTTSATTTTAPEPDNGIQYDADGNPVFVVQTLNNSSLKAYNSRNPLTVEIKITAAGDADMLAAVETGDKKKMEKIFIQELFPDFSDDFDYSVDLFVGEPIRVTYDQPELLEGYEILYSFPESVIEGSRHYPGAPSFEGMSRYIAVTFNENSLEIVDDANVISSSYGNARIKGDDNAYIVIIDKDAMYYGFRLDVDGISPR